MTDKFGKVEVNIAASQEYAGEVERTIRMVEEHRR